MQLWHSKPAPRPAAGSLDQDYLRRVTGELSFPRVYGTPENNRAADIVAEEFRALGGTCSVVGTAHNVAFGELEKARILVGAHYDSVPQSPGGDDNASAVAVMLAAARSTGPRDDVVYVAFNGEECGFLGSREFVEDVVPRMKTLEEVHVLEMVGYRDRRPHSQKNPIPFLQAPTTGDFLGTVANRQQLIDNLIGQAGNVSIPVVGLVVPEDVPLATIAQLSPNLLRSDHICFWERKIPAVMWTDTAEFRNPNYHKMTDTPDTLDYEFMAEVAALLAAVVRRFCQ
jgi:Zn-dependent M28 family amino/carboxypeptidase